MPTWNSNQYLKYSHQRTQPAIDLAARIDIAHPRRVVDLGCGPGNSTAVLARRWPYAHITGLDNSPPMIAAARQAQPGGHWIQADIASWEATPDDKPDILFSNAALQWVGDHAHLMPHLLHQLNPGGALAVQMPANSDAPPHRLMHRLAASSMWRSAFKVTPVEWHVHEPDFYYDLLAPLAARMDLWCTDYLHILEGVTAIVDWYAGTGLRPWLDALPDDPTRQRFLADYEAGLRPHFPPRRDGRVIFPFRRLFIVAYR